MAGIVALYRRRLAIDAVSRSSPAAATTADRTRRRVPSSLWYWTMAVSPSDPNVLVVGSANGLYRSDGRRQDLDADRARRTSTRRASCRSGDLLYAGGGHAAPTTSPVVRTGATRAATSGAAVLAVEHRRRADLEGPAPRRPAERCTMQAFALDPAEHPELLCGADERQGVPLDRRREVVQALVAEDRDPAVGGRDHEGRPVRGRRHGHRRLSERERHDVEEDDLHRLARREDGDGVRRPADRHDAGADDGFGIEISTDSGKTWHRHSSRTTMFGPIAWAATKPDIAYAIGFDSSIWRSDDGGKSWTKVSKRGGTNEVPKLQLNTPCPFRTAISASNA